MDYPFKDQARVNNYNFSHKTSGADTHSLPGVGRKRLPFLFVAVAIAAVTGFDVLCSNPFYGANFRPDVERSAGSDGHAPNIGSRLFAFRYDCSDHVTRLKAAHPAAGLRTGTREPIFIDQAHLSALSPCG